LSGGHHAYRSAGFTLLAVADAGFVQAGEVNMPYSPTPERPVTGTMIERPVVMERQIPIDKSYAELSPEQQSMVKANLRKPRRVDEPPYPLNGLKIVSQRIANADVSAASTANSSCKSTSTAAAMRPRPTVVQTPNVRVAQIAATRVATREVQTGNLPRATVRDAVHVSRRALVAALVALSWPRAIRCAARNDCRSGPSRRYFRPARAIDPRRLLCVRAECRTRRPGGRR
jgi:hypothetical protein